MKRTLLIAALLVSSYAYATKPATTPAVKSATEKVDTVTTTTTTKVEAVKGKVVDAKATATVKGKEAVDATKEVLKK